MLGPHVLAQDVNLQLAEAAAEFDVPRVADALVAEEDDRALVEGLLDAREGGLVDVAARSTSSISAPKSGLSGFARMGSKIPACRRLEKEGR
jgi:hypothetical protein